MVGIEVKSSYRVEMDICSACVSQFWSINNHSHSVRFPYYSKSEILHAKKSDVVHM